MHLQITYEPKQEPQGKWENILIITHHNLWDATKDILSMEITAWYAIYNVKKEERLVAMI